MRLDKLSVIYAVMAHMFRKTGILEDVQQTAKHARTVRKAISGRKGRD